MLRHRVVRETAAATAQCPSDNQAQALPGSEHCGVAATCSSITRNLHSLNEPLTLDS